MIKSRVGMRSHLVHRPVSCERALRPLRLDDEAEIEELGKLYYEAYLGTIDYDGWSREEALAEIRQTTDGAYGPLLARCSFVLEGDGRPAGATLVTEVDGSTVLLAEVMIHPDYRGRGYAHPLIQASMNAALKDGRQDMVLMVTLGNVPAESLYRRMGFEQEPAGGM